jgi:hypothetical protein
MPTPSRRFDDSEKDGKAKAPAPVFKLSPRCPTCGQEGVVVFSVIPSDSAPQDQTPRLVCLACCPKLPGDS